MNWLDIASEIQELFFNLSSMAATPAYISFPTGNILEAGRTKPGEPFGGNSIVKE